MGASLYLVGVLLPAWFPSEAGAWEDAEAEVCVSTEVVNTELSPSTIRTTIEAGVSLWFSPADGGSRLCGGFRLGFDEGSCRPVTNGQDGRTQLYFRQDWPYGPATIGFTASTVDTSRICRVVDDDTGVTRMLPCRVGSDVELNDDTVWWGRGGAVGVDLRTVVAHEVGHLLGLGHCEENGTCRPTEALMFGGYTGPLAGPAEDDDEGLCALYPESQVGLGQACGTDSACAEGQCAALVGAGRCALDCGAGCPNGQSCVAEVQACGGEGDLCGPCGQDLDCGLDALCVSGQCRPRCGEGCPNGTVCGVGSDDRRSCLGGCLGETRATEGENCDQRACQSSLVCAEGQCLRPCDGACSAGQACVERFGARFCLDEVSEGEVCSDHQFCSVGPCWARPGERPTCVRSCVGATCAAEQRCEMVVLRPGAGNRICTPPASPPSGGGDMGPSADMSVDAGRATDGGAPGRDVRTSGEGSTIEGSSCTCSGRQSSSWMLSFVLILLIGSRTPSRWADIAERWSEEESEVGVARALPAPGPQASRYNRSRRHRRSGCTGRDTRTTPGRRCLGRR